MRIIFAVLTLLVVAKAQVLSGVLSSSGSSGPAPPTYVYHADSTWNCSVSSQSCSITKAVTVGWALVASCVATGTGGSITISDDKGNTWNDEVLNTSSATQFGDTFDANVGSAVGHGFTTITCSASGSVTAVTMLVDAWESSTGWQNGPGGEPADQDGGYGDNNGASSSCDSSPSTTTSQTYELAVGQCLYTGAQPTVSSPFTVGQTNSGSTTGITGYEALTTRSAPEFETTGTLTIWQAFLLSLQPN